MGIDIWRIILLNWYDHYSSIFFLRIMIWSNLVILMINTMNLFRLKSCSSIRMFLNLIFRFLGLVFTKGDLNFGWNDAFTFSFIDWFKDTMIIFLERLFSTLVYQSWWEWRGVMLHIIKFNNQLKNLPSGSIIHFTWYTSMTFKLS